VNVEVHPIVHDFTSEKVTLIRALDEMSVEGGLSAITDALYVAAEHLAKDAEKNNSDGHKRALVVITDGLDENSFITVEKLLTLLREKQIRVYAVGFPQAVASQGIRFEERARKYLTRLADKSGGRVYFPATAADIKSVSSSLLNDMRSQ
jgi:Mg-chelatase subunit ChlD